MHIEQRGDVTHYKLERRFFRDETLPIVEASGGAALLFAGAVLAPETLGLSLIGSAVGLALLVDATSRANALE